MCCCKRNLFSLNTGMNRDSKTKGGIFGISQDHWKTDNDCTLENCSSNNFKDICRMRQTRKEKYLIRKSIINTEEGVKIIAAIK